MNTRLHITLSSVRTEFLEKLDKVTNPIVGASS